LRRRVGRPRSPAAGSPRRRPLRLHTRSRRRARLQARLAPASHAPRRQTMTSKTQIVIENGAEIDVPLSKLKKSPKNARKVPHGEAAIEALAASIGAKRMLHPLIVEPELN